MFPLPILTYVKIGLVALCLFVSGYIGYSIEAARFDSYKAEQIKLVRDAEENHQALTDQIRKEKDAQIASINISLADALIKLRERPNRAQNTTNGQGGTGLSLSAEDATFLDREAARADILRSALWACYSQYDALSVK
jgi:hypothetical protein